MSSEHHPLLDKLHQTYLHPQSTPTPAQIEQQIQEQSSHPLTQAENSMKSKGHRVKERRISERENNEPSNYNRRILGNP